MRDWLKKCCDEHRSCPKRSDHLLPTIVINVGSLANEPRLVIPENQLGQWASLSHCWGGEIALKTKMSSIDRHCHKISLENFPPTFRDAILITRSLGLRYLWIDALCILQDSHRHWETQAARMDYIYEHATVTLAAEASPDSLAGIVGSTKDHRETQSLLPTTWCQSKTRSVCGEIRFRDDLASQIKRRSRGVLSSRAWTLQEEILSPCILRFSTQQVVWRCPTIILDEWHPQQELKTRLTGRPQFCQPLYNRLLAEASLTHSATLMRGCEAQRTAWF